MAHQNETLAHIIGTGEPASETAVRDIRLHFVPADSGPRRQRRARGLSLAASVAVVVVAAGFLIGVLASGGSGGGRQAGRLGPPFNPPPGLSDATLGPGQYSYRVDQQIDVGADGKPTPHSQAAMINQNWISANGDFVSFRTGSQNGCFTFPHGGNPSFQEPNQSFFDSLPSEVDALNTYVRGHVSGSTSRDEAVFVAVGDALRTADGLATPRLRVAFVAVLSRTPGVIVHKKTRDYLGRLALRADFVDQQTRPGEVQSLFFDPATFQLLEQRDGSNSQSRTYNGGSPAYDAAPPTAADDPRELTGPAFIDVVTSEKIVDKLPTIPPNCNTH